MLKKHLRKILFIIIALIFFAIFVKFKLYVFFNYDNAMEVKKFILGFSIFGPIIIILLYMVFNVFCLPTLFFTFISGYLYGPVSGFFVAWIGMILGFMTSFFNVRYIFRNDFNLKYGNNKMVIKLEDYAARFKGLAVLFFRVFFIIPYNLQNVAYGLSKIKAFHFLWGSSIGILPTTLFFVIFGDAISSNKITLIEFRNISGLFFVFVVILGALLVGSYFLKKKITGSNTIKSGEAE